MPDVVEEVKRLRARVAELEEKIQQGSGTKEIEEKLETLNQRLQSLEEKLTKEEDFGWDD